MRHLQTVCVTLALLIAGPVAADTEAIRQKIEGAWERITELTAAGNHDELGVFQRKTARELYEYYLAHREEPIAGKAITDAFRMWANVGDVEAMDKALPEVDRGLRSWPTILRSIRNGFHRGGRGEESTVALFRKLKDELTHPDGRGSALLQLGEWHTYRGEESKAIPYFRAVLELGADPYLEKKARLQLHELETLGIGVEAPTFKGTAIGGGEFDLAGQRGKLVLIEFWATTCAPCIPEIPYLRRIYREHGGERFEIVGIPIDHTGRRVAAFTEHQQMLWPQVHDGKGFDGEIAQLYNVTQIPRSFLIGPDGKIVGKDVRKEKLVELVSKLLTPETTP